MKLKVQVVSKSDARATMLVYLLQNKLITI
jgi:hypothetical protein